jgi:hypothetical protein
MAPSMDVLSGKKIMVIGTENGVEGKNVIEKG